MNREITASHEQDWIRACKENPQSRVRTASDCSEAGPFNEMVVMGVLAVRLQGLNRELEWDGEKMKFKEHRRERNDADHDRRRVHDPQRAPDLQQTLHRSVQRERVCRTDDRYNYRDGWELPAMPK